MRRKTSLLGGAAVGVMLAVVATAPVQAKTVKTTEVSETQQEIDDLRQQLQALKDRLDEQTQINQQSQTQLQAAQADAASAKAQAQQSEAELKQAQAQIIQTIPAEVNTAVAANKPKTDKIYYKGITITMGGFAAAETAYRSADESADIGSSYSKIPFANDRAGQTGETDFTARQSRYSILAQGNVNADTVAGFYGEFDFLGAAQTANSNESNSYQPRIRNLYGQIDWNASGWHILAGQSWSLVTLQNNGISPRSEVSPATIDAQYVPGFAWARQPGFRITKDFDKELWIALSVENPQTTFGGTAPATTTTPGSAVGVPGVTVVTQDAPTSQFYSGTNYSLNTIPDIIGKVAWEKKLGDSKLHVEAFGLYRTFTDRVNYNAAAASVLGATAGNYTLNTSGGGAGGSIAIYDLVPQHLDVQASVMAGNGIGRYGAGQLSDVTLKPNGSLVGIPETMWLAGGTFHANPTLDFYAYAGQESENGKISLVPGAITEIGYGTLPGSNNAGCIVEGGSCSALTKSIDQYTGGLWWKFYNGSFGQARWGIQYSYTERKAFPDAAAGLAPLGKENMVFTSFRFYPF